MSNILVLIEVSSPATLAKHCGRRCSPPPRGSARRSPWSPSSPGRRPRSPPSSARSAHPQVYVGRDRPGGQPRWSTPRSTRWPPRCGARSRRPCCVAHSVDGRDVAAPPGRAHPGAAS